MMSLSVDTILLCIEAQELAFVHKLTALYADRSPSTVKLVVDSTGENHGIELAHVPILTMEVRSRHGNLAFATWVEYCLEAVEEGSQITTKSAIESVIGNISRLGKAEAPKVHKLKSDIDFKDLVKFRILGVGTFGKVWLVSHKKSGSAYALKMLNKREIIGHHQVEGVIREKNIMTSIDHPFVVNLICTFQDDRHLYMLIEMVQGGELFSVIHTETRDGIPNANSRFYAACILESLAHLHHRHITYRDLKPENILIDALGYCVLVDLGFAKIVMDKTYTLCGTPLYLAPEVILSRGHDKGADYWSLGCLMYEMILGQTPFYDHNIDQITLFKRIVHGRYRFPSHSFSEEAQDLIAGMLANKLTQRLGCLAQAERDIKDHPFMADINFGKLGKRMMKAPWVPMLRDPLDASCFESWDHLDDKETTVDYKSLSKKENDIFLAF